MIRACLLALPLSLLPVAASAQAPEPVPPAAAAPAAPPAAADAPPTEAKAVTAGADPAAPAPQGFRQTAVLIEIPAKAGDEILAELSRGFFDALIARDFEKLAMFCKPPFLFENRVATTQDEIRKRWGTLLPNKPLDGIKLMGIEAVNAEDMLQKYGKPPDRLSAWPAKGGIYTIGNLSGHPVVVLWKKVGPGWLAIAAHD